MKIDDFVELLLENNYTQKTHWYTTRYLMKFKKGFHIIDIDENSGKRKIKMSTLLKIIYSLISLFLGFLFFFIIVYLRELYDSGTDVDFVSLIRLTPKSLTSSIFVFAPAIFYALYYFFFEKCEERTELHIEGLIKTQIRLKKLEEKLNKLNLSNSEE